MRRRTQSYIPLVNVFFNFSFVTRFGLFAPLSSHIISVSSVCTTIQFSVIQSASKVKLKIFLKRRKRASVNNLIYSAISRQNVSFGVVRSLALGLRVRARTHKWIPKHKMLTLVEQKHTQRTHIIIYTKMKRNEVTTATGKKLIVRHSVHDWFGLYSFHFTFNPLFVCSGWAVVMMTATAAASVTAAPVNNVLDSSENEHTEKLKSTQRNYTRRLILWNVHKYN